MAPVQLVGRKPTMRAIAPTGICRPRAPVPSRRRGRALAVVVAGAALCTLAALWRGAEDGSFAVPPRPSAPSPVALRATAASNAALMTTEDRASFEVSKAALMKRMVKEYKSFFRPFQGESYSEDMAFRDPLISTKGRDMYQWMIELLAGSNMVGSHLFSDGFLDMHAVEEVPEDKYKVRTRWTAGLKFKMVPWTPTIFFTGISEYTLDSSAQVTGQRDYWDTVNLVDEGRYATEPIFSGYGDMSEQMLPPFIRKGQEPEMVHSGEWSLLRRANKYRVYRSKDGTVFALSHPDAASSDMGDLSRSLQKHGLSSGKRLRVQLSGAGLVKAEESEAGGDAAGKTTRSWPPVRDDGEGDTVVGLELLRPHPWDGRNAPPEAE